MEKNKKNDNNANLLNAFVLKYGSKNKSIKYRLDKGNTFVVNVKKAISFEERTEMVRSIVSAVFIGENEFVENYMPEYLGLAQKMLTIEYFTDIDLPQDVGSMWLILNNTPIFEDVANILGKYLYDIFEDANELIHAKRDYVVRKTDLNRLFDKFSAKIDSLGDNFTKADIQTMVKLIEKLPKNLTAEQVIDSLVSTGLNKK